MYDDSVNISLKTQEVLNRLDLVINDIKLNKLFSDSFIKKCTHFSNIDELLKSGNFIGNLEDSLEPLCNEYSGKYVLSTSKFLYLG